MTIGHDTCMNKRERMFSSKIATWARRLLSCLCKYIVAIYTVDIDILNFHGFPMMFKSMMQANCLSRTEAAAVRTLCFIPHWIMKPLLIACQYTILPSLLNRAESC